MASSLILTSTAQLVPEVQAPFSLPTSGVWSLLKIPVSTEGWLKQCVKVLWQGAYGFFEQVNSFQLNMLAFLLLRSLLWSCFHVTHSQWQALSLNADVHLGRSLSVLAAQGPCTWSYRLNAFSCCAVDGNSCLSLFHWCFPK